MSVRRLMAMAGGLIIAFSAVPRVQLHGQLDALRQDSRFIFDAASSNLLEVRLGQLAQSKATNAAVKQFGQQMVTDHTNLQNQLTATVSKGGTKFQPGLNDEDEKEFERLEDISGAEFDREYMTAMIQHHQEDVAAFQSQTQSARSAEARQIASTGLPVLQQHLNMAVQVGRQIGVNTGVAVTDPTTPTPPVATPTPAPNTGTPPVATPQPVPGAQSDVSADMPFIRQAGSSNLVEIRLGQAAQNKGSNPAVKQFAQRMVTDHTNMQNQLTAAAATGGQTYTPAIDASDQWQVTRIERLSGADFDRAYMSYMIRAHQTAVSQFQIQSQSARSNQIRTLATNSLPMLQQHLSLAAQVGNQVGADTTTTVAGPNQPRGGNRGDVPAPAEFVQEVNADNMMMIQLGELAQERARNREVREFAEREARDHERLQNQWTSMASRHGLPSRPGMGPRHREKVTQLERARGNNFDRVYITLMIQQHSDEVSYWRKEGRANRSAQVRELVNRGLPMLERHFEQAKEIGRQIGVNPDAALRNRTDVSRARNNNQRNRD